MIIAQDTDYIFLDEPLNNLDMKHSVEMMKLLKRLVEDFAVNLLNRDGHIINIFKHGGFNDLLRRPFFDDPSVFQCDDMV
jgi:ABC-type ATPase involved in cell division